VPFNPLMELGDIAMVCLRKLADKKTDADKSFVIIWLRVRASKYDARHGAFLWEALKFRPVKTHIWFFNNCIGINRLTEYVCFAAAAAAAACVA
jgi:hypothetical protein